jgi:hypothetical protein
MRLRRARQTLRRTALPTSALTCNTKPHIPFFSIRTPSTLSSSPLCNAAGGADCARVHMSPGSMSPDATSKYWLMRLVRVGRSEVIRFLQSEQDCRGGPAELPAGARAWEHGGAGTRCGPRSRPECQVVNPKVHYWAVTRGEATLVTTFPPGAPLLSARDRVRHYASGWPLPRTYNVPVYAPTKPKFIPSA